MKTPSPYEIVQRLGGRHIVGAATGALPPAVSQWYRSGIPWKHHSALLAFAQEQGVPLTRLELERSRLSDELRGGERRKSPGGGVGHLAMAS